MHDVDSARSFSMDQDVEYPQRETMLEKSMPFMASLTVHACVVAAGLLMAQVVSVVTKPANVEFMAAAADTSLVDTTNLQMNQPTQLPSERYTQDEDPTAPADATGFNSTRAAATGAFQSDANDTSGGADPTIGLSFTRGHPSNARGTGKGTSGGEIAPFGTPGSPRVPDIFNPGTPARSIAYVCDASGSMLSYFDDLRQEIAQSVGKLKPYQSYNVIFFQDTSSAAASKSGLLIASSANRTKTRSLLENVTPRGQTDPLPALQLAFSQKPEVIFLLTDGDFPDNQAVMQLIRQLNGTKQTQVHTIAFMNRGEAYEKVLKQIAQENGGVFRYVEEKDLSH